MLKSFNIFRHRYPAIRAVADAPQSDDGNGTHKVLFQNNLYEWKNVVYLQCYSALVVDATLIPQTKDN